MYLCLLRISMAYPMLLPLNCLRRVRPHSSQILIVPFSPQDIYGVSQALATELFEKGEAILFSDDVCEMTPMQLYAITERLKLALPTCCK